ncbi:MAG: membrane protein insertase YidC [Candidatus Omnitrophota bacterium]
MPRNLKIVLLTFAALMVWTFFVHNRFPQKAPLSEPTNQIADNQGLSQTTEQEQPLNKIATFAEVTTETKDFEIGEYFVKVSEMGGYISEISFINDQNPLNISYIGLVPGEEQKPFTVARDGDSLIFVSGENTTKKFIFENFTISLLLNYTPESIIFFHNYQSKNGLDQRYQEIFYGQGPQIIRNPHQKQKQSLLSNINFIGTRDRYYCFSLLKGNYTVNLLKDAKRGVSALLNFPSSEVQFFVGPQKSEILNEYGLSEIINFGFFHTIALFLLKIILFFHFLTKNFGFSIILFTIFLYAVFLPLTIKSTKGMKGMQDFQAIHKSEIEKLRQKYKDNPQKIHKETMDLYKKHGFNPLKGCSSGCLPMFFRIPVIWAFWSIAPRFWGFKGANFLWINDLSNPDHLFKLPFTLPVVGNWINILPILTTVLLFLQMKMSNPNVDPEQKQQQQMMATIFPIMLAVFLYNLPAALLLYWFTDSILTFFTQRKLMKVKSTN